jgi:uncharacterized protein
MKVISNKNEMDLPIKIYRYDTFYKRLKGLMFQLRPIRDEGIFLIPCNSIHMFFMFFPIDVIFLNKDNQIVYLKENVRPWTFIPPIKQAKSALELPIGTIQKYQIAVGDCIKL